ncbi:MAG: stage II sporulation protein M [Planctomycetota bacterium]|nr:stage II sporulation protein M [Planctomycetota bacterium]
MSDYIARNRPDWEELEKLVARARRSIRDLSPEELARLDVLYRRTTVHLAQVATRTRDASLARYLNDLTAAAHSVIYLPPRGAPLKSAWAFVHDGFARAVARSWRYHAIAAGLILLGAIIAYFAVQQDQAAAYALLPEGEFRQPGASREQLLQALRYGRDEGSGQKFAFASFLFSHNLQVGLLSLALGVLAAVPSVILLIYNGMMLGAFTAVHHGSGIYVEYWAWIIPHGVTEIGAIVLCGGIGLQLGRAVVCPGRFTRAESLRRSGVEAMWTTLGVAGMLVVAAVIESYLRQSHLPTASRLVFAAGTFVFWASYFAHGFLAERRLKKNPKF